MTYPLPRRVLTAVIVATTTLLAGACGDDDVTDPDPVNACASTVIDADITRDCTLVASRVYTLKGFRKVTNGATLTIEPGTKIVGDTLTPGSSLFITRGAKIMAVGTATAPIVFTSARAPGNRRPGDWGGIIIVGNATINRTGTTILTEGPSGENYAGGTNDNDNSGTLKYVRIEFAGYGEVADQELNSLTMYAVGRGTTIDYVQAVAGADDAFEWFGGTVDAKHLVSYETGDDHFDWSEGYRGRNQFLIAYQSRRLALVPPGIQASDPQGFEGDGCEISASKPGCATYFNAPLSMPVFANYTLIGTGSLVTGYPSGGGRGAVIRRGTGGTFLNGVIARWSTRGINMRNHHTDTLRMRDSLIVRNLVLAGNGSNFDPVSATDTLNLGYQSKFVVTGSGIVEDGGSAASLFVKLPADTNATTAASFDWTPAGASTIRQGGLSTFSGLIGTRAGSAVTPTSYMGAADPAGNRWWEGWTTYVVR